MLQPLLKNGMISITIFSQMSIKSYPFNARQGIVFLLCFAKLMFSDVAFGMTTKQTSMDRQASARQPAAESIWIVKPTDVQSCSIETDFTLKQGIQELKKSHIPVLEAKEGNDGKMHIQVCGAKKGTTDAYLIPARFLPQALALGYQKAGE